MLFRSSARRRSSEGIIVSAEFTIVGARVVELLVELLSEEVGGVVGGEALGAKVVGASVVVGARVVGDGVVGDRVVGDGVVGGAGVVGD